MAFNTTPDWLIKLHNIGFKLVPLASDAKTPSIKSWLPIYYNPNYWTEEKLRKESYRFENVATCFSQTIKDDGGEDTYLLCIDIDSQKVYDILFNLQHTDANETYSLIALMQERTFVTKTKKPFGFHLYWREHKQHKPIHTEDCKAGYEFEIKTDNTSGLSSLPDSVHRDDSTFRYRNNGKEIICVRDGLYDEIMAALSECLNTESSTKNGESKYHNKIGDGIELSNEDIMVICGSISKYYNKNHRYNLVLALSGLLHKSGVKLESACELVEMLAKDDEEKKSRISTLEETYKKDPASVSGKRWFLKVLSSAIADVDKDSGSEDLKDTAKWILDKLFRIIGVLSDIVAQATETIMNDHIFVTIEESKEIWYYDDGVYVPGGDIIIEKELDAIFGYELKNKDIIEIQRYIMRKTYHKLSEFDADINIQNLKNGLYNVMTNEFMEHTPNYLSLSQKPIRYNPNAKPKLFGKFMREVLYPKEIRTGVEMMAYTFCNRNPFEIINYLIGYGSNGKGVFTGLITELHGPKNISNVPLKELTEDPFATSDLENKAANIDPELSTSMIMDPSMLKRLTGKQPVRIVRKNQRAYDTLLHAKLFLSANKIPQTSDDSDGYYRRNVMISFPNKFEGKTDDPDLQAKITTNEEEMSGIFNVLMIALRRIMLGVGSIGEVRIKGIFINEKTIQQRREKYEKASNPIRTFIEMAFSYDSVESDTITKDELYEGYKRFCKEQRLAVESKENLGKALKGNFMFAEGREGSGARRTLWKGIKLNKEYSIEIAQQRLEIK
jgi:P4 family phage/plasmid primase-like protien